ncbi:thioredoxin [Mucilaginibacter frigoritolerans]|jgi:thioredoxin 1|uniref:Thioredoxin n=1 Tax=Mucilaginibacter frigoritolerans TaxID=652788 RepID=A0A562TLA4_9SPHI|nr:thioredoxin family protein [Mucilaginibacter frigoritolerans]TWI94341.1 thioredoxin [Mucilaginibacter frigoritolerans]
MTTKFNSGFYRYFIQFAFVGTLLFAGNKSGVVPTMPAKNASHIIFIEDQFDEALKQGRLQKKYIFVDAYASWCGPCKMLKKRTFTDDKAAAFFNANFINVSIDMEKGQGPALAQQWQLQAYPTLIIFNPQGKPVLGTVGYVNADDLIRFGKQGLTKQ